jgi:hypothetical protein
MVIIMAVLLLDTLYNRNPKIYDRGVPGRVAFGSADADPSCMERRHAIMPTRTRKGSPNATVVARGQNEHNRLEHEEAEKRKQERIAGMQDHNAKEHEEALKRRGR